MTTLKILLLICVSAFVGNMVLMILESAPMNIWVARFIAGIASATTGALIAYYYQRKRSNQKL
ncbi:hypothetical protein [Staphylococcus caeli]|uniref:hypothetical protein n=1 Tax=Staphylococcus caeli TaxID=2201815 RepID=UPI003F573AED